MKSTDQPARPRRRGPGFTLVEVLVSLALILVLLLILVSMTDSVRHTWSYTNGEIEGFRGAREAFEAITRRLSQATLNTYLDYEYPTGTDGTPDTSRPPTRYVRQSELRFLCGDAATLTQSADCVTHGIFFQAQTGVVGDSGDRGMESLLNTWGYFVRFGDDSQSRPDFINEMPSPPASRYRFRLMEMAEPSESLSLYDAEVNAGGNSGYTGTGWITKPLASPGNSRVLAENVVALVVLPKLTPQEDPTGTKLSPAYSYDSTTSGQAKNATGQDANDLNSKNQLPPVVQVTLVAVDEASYSRFQTGSAMKDLGLGSLFKSAGDLADDSKPGYAHDLKTLTGTLTANRIGYRVFTTDVTIRAAKWSRDQKGD